MFAHSGAIGATASESNGLGGGEQAFARCTNALHHGAREFALE